jgi:hypothetical protein
MRKEMDVEESLALQQLKQSRGKGKSSQAHQNRSVNNVHPHPATNTQINSQQLLSVIR